MDIFRRTRGPEGGAVSGGKSPVIPSLSRNKKAGGVKIITGLIKIIAGLIKVKEEVKILREVMSFFTRNF